MTPYPHLRREADVGSGKPPIAVFYGGAHFGGLLGWNMNWVLHSVRLSLHSSGLRLGPPVRWMSLLTPVWEARFDELVSIWETGRRFNPGIRFVTRDGAAVTFWGSQRCLEQVAAGLRACGVEWLGDDGVPTEVSYSRT